MPPNIFVTFVHAASAAFVVRPSWF